jgi:hypothetical protein
MRPQVNGLGWFRLLQKFGGGAALGERMTANPALVSKRVGGSARI